MKKILGKLTLVLLTTLGISSCGGSEVMMNKDDFRHVYLDTYDDKTNNINESTIKGSKVFYGGEYISDYSIEFSKSKDIKYEFVSDTHTRFVNSSDGYVITLPSNEISFDYSLSQYRIQSKYSDSILTVSYEHSSPYGESKSGWETYLNEWLIRYINNPKFLEDNNLSYVYQVEKYVRNDKIEIQTFSIVINDNRNITHPYYNISVVREVNSYIDFYLFVQKSSSNRNNEHKQIIDSFKLIDKFGRSKLHIGELELKRNPLWNEETNEYFTRMQDYNTFDFGFFRFSLKGNNEPEQRDEITQKVKDDNNWYKENMGYEVEILPTYTHLGFYETDTFFPVVSAKELAGGNGKNGLPVLQFTLQYTRNNNNVSIYNTESNNTPVYDILRGKYDGYFRRMARDVREYAKPILFRLNNEMNTDWTSYSGIISLLDPDIFQMTWRRLYDIFTDEGVDNCIWIFNPVADSCPYSSWGEDMCYMPGIDYVQALGVTKYEMLNDRDYYLKFSQGYGESSALYKKNKTTWANYPWIISEFGCGSGGSTSGELYRNQDKQALWVEEMFDYFSNKESMECMKRYSAAVWFNCNDVVGELIENALYIAPNLEDTISAFKVGFEKIKNKNLK